MQDSFGIVSPAVEKYLDKIARPRDKVLSHLEKDAERNDVPIIGPVCGNILYMLATSCRAKNILEIGTATGYSGIILARVATKNSGKLTTIEMDPERIKIAKKSFADAQVSNAVEILEGDVREILPDIVRSKKRFEVIFLDVGDKTIYIDLLDPCVSVLEKGGYLVADNTLRAGHVANPSDHSMDSDVMREFNDLVFSDKRLLPAVIPMRDGMTVCLKLTE